MAYVTVENFAGGMDVRSAQVAGKPGTLWRGVNVHITRGGEVERRKKFVAKYTLPIDNGSTHGLHDIDGELYVFGSGAVGSFGTVIPTGVNYQRLRHPNGTTAMGSLIFAENFDGAIYAIAEFADGSVYHFYDGTIVSDWLNGIVRADMVNNSGIATHLRALVDADADYAAGGSVANVDITGPVGEAFTCTASTEESDGSAADLQTVTVTMPQAAVAGVSEVLASASFRVVGGAASAGVNKITSVKVNSVEILNTAVDWATSNAITAANIASQINSYNSTPEYTAAASGSTVTITAAAGSGIGPNGFSLEVTVAGEFIVTTGGFRIAGGSASAGVNKVTSVTVNGVEIMDTDVDWVTSNTATAAAVAAQIRSYSSTPEYTASNDGPTVLISPLVASDTAPANLTVVVTTAGNVSTDNNASVNKTCVGMSGGVAAVAGQAQISRVAIGGTFEVGDRFSIALTRGGVTKNFGAEGNPAGVGRTALTFKSKMYSTAASILNFSGVNDATVWNRDNLDTPGANFINMSAKDQGSQTLVGLEVYQGNLAVFSRKTIQIWVVEDDEDSNVFLQALRNIGTQAPKSIIAYGTNDVVFLAASGIRSLRARDSSNAAFVSDVGTAIDPHVVAYVKSLSSSRRQAAIAFLEPDTDRLWMFIGGRIYVFSYFPGSKISAWSYYDTTDDIGTDVSGVAIDENDRIYVRSGRTIYLYGGDDDDTYPDADEIVGDIELPFLTSNTPGSFKTLTGIDVAMVGVAEVTLYVNPKAKQASDDAETEPVGINAGVITGTTYAENQIPITEETTHVAPRFLFNRAGYGKLTNVTVHYVDPVQSGS